MKSLKDNLEDFYLKNKDLLEKFYPGLSFSHLTREFLVFAENLRDFDENLLSTPFCSLKKEEFEHFTMGLLKGVPLQQISGKAYFYRTEFLVNKDVLIPRPESEILVSMAVEFANKNQVKNILEIGTGSGCLIISLIRELSHVVNAWAVDISPLALVVAKRNAFRLQYSLHPDSQIHFLESDLLAKIPKELSYSLIISNPPYIKESQKNQVHTTVDHFEPHLALYLSDKEYSHWYIRFFREVAIALTNEGMLMMEGHEENLVELQKLARQEGLKHVVLSKDYNGRLRFLIAQK